MSEILKGVSTNKNQILSAFSLFFAALGLRTSYYLQIKHGSPRVISDSREYIGTCARWKDGLLPALQQPAGSNFQPAAEYAGMTIPFCTIYELLGQSVSAWIWVQLTISSVTVVIVYLISARHFEGWFVFLPPALLTIHLETFRWTTWLMSETVFIFSLVVMMLMLDYHLDMQTRNSRVLTLITLGWMATTRPFGIPIAATIIAMDLYPAPELRPNLLGKWPARVGAVIGAVIIMGLGGRTDWIDRVLNASLQEGWIFIGRNHNLGIPVPGGLDYNFTAASSSLVTLLTNLDHYIMLATARAVLFYIPLMPFWRRNIVFAFGSIVSLIIIPMAGYGTISLLRNRIRYSRRIYWLLPIAATTGVVAFTFLTQHYRYRAPLGPFFVLVAGHGAWTVSQQNLIPVNDIIQRLRSQ
ncbi:hypothetical protein [Halomicrobium sp. LC1Hm]|uniref:hypothetical protein n=1 Tax=Halomicrobium sp. LC1Hm TaxID=2610902 RepID=UPI0012985185|nr:hypothetical protein [Halomicrobium sp. LC1Hm]